MIKLVLIDTSAWIEFLRKDGSIEMRQKVVSLMRMQSARVCEPVLLELYSGAQGNEVKTIRELEQTVDLLFCKQHTWIRAINYAKKLRTLGYTIKGMDIIIQAIGDENGAEILAVDKHFDIMKKALSL